LTRQTATRFLIHAIDLAPQIHELTQFLHCRYFPRSSSRTVDSAGACRNSGLLKHYIETRIGWDGDADVLRICRVRQLLFAGKSDVIRQTISQQGLASNRPAEARAAANHVGGYCSHAG